MSEIGVSNDLLAYLTQTLCASLLSCKLDPKLRFFFELSLRKKSSGIGLFISFHGAKKFSRTIGGDYAGISQRSVTILDGEHGPLSFPLLKDVSKKYRKNKTANSTAGQDVRGFAFSSLEDGCGLLELCKHDVWPLPCQGTFMGII